MLFWLHISISAIFFALLIFSYYKNFIKANRNTTRAKIKLALILFGWSCYSLLGVVLLFPRGSQNNLQEVCGMFWLADIAFVLISIIFETLFLLFGLFLIYTVKGLEYSSNPISIFNDE